LEGSSLKWSWKPNNNVGFTINGDFNYDGMVIRVCPKMWWFQVIAMFMGKMFFHQGI
jgi:hypothetical protein